MAEPTPSETFTTRPLKLRLFGGFQLEDANGKMIAISLRKAEALLVYLAMSPGQRASRENLAALLWGEAEQHRARQSLRQTLLALTKALASSEIQVLRMESQTVSLVPGAVTVDALEMVRLLEEGSAESLLKAAGLYQGELIAGLVVDAEEFEEWLTLTRGRLHDQALKALTGLLDKQITQGDTDGAIDTASRALRVDSYREDIHRQLMQLYIEKGMRSSALAQFRICRDILNRELSVQPDEQTVRLYKSILEDGGSSPSVRPTLPVSTGTRPALSEGAPERQAVYWGDRPIGRDQELEALDRLLGAAIAGQGRAVAVIGEAGIGKSYLIRGFLDGCDPAEIRQIGLQGRQADRALYMIPWIEALRPLVGKGASKGSEESALLQRWLGGRRRGASERPADDMERKQLFDAVVALLRGEAANSPLVIHFEDLHWADDESVRLLSYCVRQLAGEPILFLVSLRAVDGRSGGLVGDLLDDLAGHGHLSWLTLKPLSQLECADLVAQIEAKLELPEEAHKEVDEIWTLSEGNPQVIAEYTVPLRVREARRELFGALFPRQAITDAQHIRADLSEQARMLLATACVLGPRANYRVLMAAAELDEAATARGIEDLVGRQILAIDADDVVFVHLRVCRTLYEDLVPPRRRLLHAACAGAMEQVYREVLELHYQTIAYHAREGGLYERALDFQISAAQVEFSRGAFGAAGKVLRQALKTAQLAEEGPERFAPEARCHVLLAQIEETSSGLNRALSHVKTAERLVKRRLAGRPQALALLSRVLLARSRLEYRLGRSDVAFDSARQALAGPSGTEICSAWTGLELVLTRLHLMVGRQEQIDFDLRQRLERCAEVELGIEEVETRLVLALLLALQRNFEEAHGACQAAMSRAEALGSEATMGACHFAVGMVGLWTGRAREAARQFEAALAIAEETGDLPRLYLITGFRGLAMLARDQADEGRDNLRAALEMAERLGSRLLLAYFKAVLAEAWPEAEDDGRGEELADEALSLATATNQPWARSIALRAKAVLLGRQRTRHLADAERAIGRAVVIQRGLQLDMEVARSLVLHAKIVRARGDTERAIGLYAEAGALYRGLGQDGEARRIATLSDALRPSGRTRRRGG
ncbi:MAG: AAA family ATPase [Pseudomonadota bacterium]